jgi:hypothetical protein
MADKPRERGFVAGAAAGHDGNLVWIAGCIWAAEDNFIFFV